MPLQALIVPATQSIAQSNVLLCTNFALAYALCPGLYMPPSVWPTQWPTRASILGGINPCPMLCVGLFLPKEKTLCPMLWAIHKYPPIWPPGQAP